MEKLSSDQLKEKLAECDQAKLVTLISDLYKNYPMISEYINAEFADENYMRDLLEEKKKAIEKLFFPNRVLSHFPMKEAKKIISDFKKVCKDPICLIDLQLHYVEAGVELINEYGDGPESFYDSLDNTFEKIAKSLNRLKSESIYKSFETRIRKVVKDVNDFGYGMGDSMGYVLSTIKWYKDE